MTPKIRDEIEFVKDLVAGIKFEMGWAKSEREFAEKAKSALVPIKDDALYIAQVLRKYRVQERSYDPHRSLQELVSSETPLEQEVQRYSQAIEAVSNAISRSDLPLGAQINMSRTLRDLYFNPNYQLPELE